MDSRTVFIKTWGCAANKAESEIVAGLLTRSGFTVVSSPELADILIFNTCSVKETTKNKILFELKKASEKYKSKIIIVIGCLPEIDYNAVKETVPEANLISTNYITKISSVIQKIVEGEQIELLGKEKYVKVCLPKVRENRIIDIIPICSGCLSDCSYCATKLAKGDLFSYPPDKIIQEIKEAKNAGAKEFWLTGQDVSVYGFDFNYEYKLPDLLQDIIDKIRGKYFIRVGMLNPAFVKLYLDNLLNVFQHENIFKFIHVPVQSGSDEVLRKMRRGYTAQDFVQIVQKFRKKIPEITVWTDIIVGFPGETDEDFKKTKKLIMKIKPDWVNVSRFSSHPGTQAHEMKQINTEVKKRRSRELSQIVERIVKERNEKWVGWEGEVLIDEALLEKRSIFGRNYTYKQIVLPFSKSLIGKFVKVKVKEAKSTCLLGELL